MLSVIWIENRIKKNILSKINIHREILKTLEQYDGT